jgi:hypothetical protein
MAAQAVAVRRSGSNARTSPEAIHAHLSEAEPEGFDMLAYNLTGNRAASTPRS